MSNKAFYMVWNPSGAQPRHQHASLELAEKEAERLAKSNPGEYFYVLQAVLKLNVPPPVIKTTLLP